MSRTTRRTKLNRKKHFFQHYWEMFSHAEIDKAKWITEWKYHSDNYYTKSCKDRKQFLKNLVARQMRREAKSKLKNFNEDPIFSHEKPRSIKWDLH